jgi:hypothetical protein
LRWIGIIDPIPQRGTNTAFFFHLLRPDDPNPILNALRLMPHEKDAPEELGVPEKELGV